MVTKSSFNVLSKSRYIRRRGITSHSLMKASPFSGNLCVNFRVDSAEELQIVDINARTLYQFTISLRKHVVNNPIFRKIRSCFQKNGSVIVWSNHLPDGAACPGAFRRFEGDVVEPAAGVGHVVGRAGAFLKEPGDIAQAIQLLDDRCAWDEAQARDHPAGSRHFLAAEGLVGY
jgi:hypothetical protein